jgi:hypothetical protein
MHAVQLKDALITALQSLPPDFVVGFIVFGSSVRVYRLNHDKEVMHADVIGGRTCPSKEQLLILSKQVRWRRPDERPRTSCASTAHVA